MVERQNILVVEVEQDTYDEIASVLTRNDFAVDRIPTASAGLELVTLVSFKAIIVNHPLKSTPLADFLMKAKGPESASSEALVGVFVSTKNPADKTPFEAEAEVVRHAVGATGENAGMGLRFISFHDGNLGRLSRFLESYELNAPQR